MTTVSKLQASTWAVGLIATLSGIFVLGATGCARVKFLDADNRRAGNIGFEYFPPKPYLAIETAADGTRKATIVCVPDVSRPMRVKHVTGWGTSDFSFTVTNGMITTFGQKMDSKGPETIKEYS